MYLLCNANASHGKIDLDLGRTARYRPDEMGFVYWSSSHQRRTICPRYRRLGWSRTRRVVVDGDEDEAQLAAVKGTPASLK
jgi:hypothetical protein